MILRFVLLLTLAVTALAQTELRALSDTLEKLSGRVSRAVVQIFTTGYTISNQGEGKQTSYLSQQRGSGSGVLLTADGYILTNSHVVQGARRIRVQVSQSKSKAFDGKVLGVDRVSDLALIKIAASGLPFLEFGDSDRLHQGQLVLAFGNPLGLENSVSLGIVSSAARQLKADDPMIYIQTDAPINPGNSGGPLIDSAGHVMGINTFILSQSGGSEGLGFAIPSNIAKAIYQHLRKDGHVHRGQIGVLGQSLDPILAAGLSLTRDSGVILSDVAPSGPADEAGVKVGDIVLALDGKPLENARQLEINIHRAGVGNKVTLKVLRGQAELDIPVPVVDRDDDPERFADLVDPEKNLIRRLGILGIEIDKQVAELLPEIRNKFGVVVAARAGGDTAAQIGLQAGDVIYYFNNNAIASIETLRKLLNSLKPGDPVVLQVERNGVLHYLSFEFE